MKKLLSGIIDFQNNITSDEKSLFAKLALGQSPDALLITCSDSRVAPNVFASTNPGDLFVVRNVGNMVSPCGEHGVSTSDQSEAAALEFAINELKVKDIIVCGHAECGAMQALLHEAHFPNNPHLNTWLKHGKNSLETLRAIDVQEESLKPHNRLSQINVLQQIEHLKTYPFLNKKIISGEVNLHGWWFDIESASVHWYVSALNKFIPINQTNGDLLEPMIHG